MNSPRGESVRAVRVLLLCGWLAACCTLTGCVITRDRDVNALSFPAAPHVEPATTPSTAQTVVYETPAVTQAGGSNASVPPWVAIPSEDGCLPSCRPHAHLAPLQQGRSTEPNCFPPQQHGHRPAGEANCAGCEKVQQSISQQTEDLESRFNARIAQLEKQLQESLAQTEDLRAMLMKSSQETVRLQHEVMECKGTIAEMQADFKRQQLEDLKALEGLSNSLRTVLTAEAPPESEGVTK